jgi:hypothetical protein
MLGAAAFALEAGAQYVDTINELNQVSARMRTARKPFIAEITKEQREAKKTAREAFDDLTPEDSDKEIAESFRNLATASAPIAAASKKANDAINPDDTAKAKELRKDAKKQFQTFASALAMPLVLRFRGK